MTTVRATENIKAEARKLEIFVGYDSREKEAFEVAKASILKHYSNANIQSINLGYCGGAGLYTRPFVGPPGRRKDVISRAPMSTDFALTRFLVPWLSEHKDLAIFIDCDMLVRCDIRKMLKYADDQCAVSCVKHEMPRKTSTKMDGCWQLPYARKNWSSVMLWNLRHPAFQKFTLSQVNTLRGLDLHQFTWLKDDEIGELPAEWNHLVGVDVPRPDAKIVHFTLGIPTMRGYENCEYADEWREYHK